MGLMATLIVALVGVVVVLPKMVDEPNAEAVVERPGETVAPPPESPSQPPDEIANEPMADGLRRTIDEALSAGEAALAGRDPAGAATAFGRASVLDPGNAAAEDGLRKTKIFAEVQRLETAAVAHERRGEYSDSAIAARRALELDPRSGIARSVADRLARRDAENAYLGRVTLGLAALEAGRYQEAIDAFSSASELRPATPEVADGLSRARAGLRRERVSAHLTRATAAEKAEDWSTAVEEYRSALAIEAQLAAASDGLARSAQRLDLTRKMDYHLAHAERLATVEVMQEAADLVAEAGAVPSRGPQFSKLVDRLDDLIGQYSTPVSVILESDGLTDVMLYRFGRLGVFSRSTVELRPGTYTAVGRRPGYRDVRLTIRVPPGQSPQTVEIRCTERI